MKRGYIRISKAGPTLEAQQSALASAGLDDFSEYGPVYVDEPPRRRTDPSLPQRDYAIRSLFEGDELVIASAARLGTSAVDVLAALEAISRKGAVVYDVEAAEAVRWHPDALKVIAFAQRAESGNRKEITAKMRRRRVETGLTGGAPPKAGKMTGKEVQALWDDLTIPSSSIVERTGLSQSTLYRRFGQRGAPRGGRRSGSTEA